MSTIRRLTVEVRGNREMRREAYSMSIYVAIVLLSALAAFDENHPPERGEVFLFELGTTIGLVLAHALATWISTKVVGDEADDVDQWDLLRVQLLGAAFVAGLAMLALVLTPSAIELTASRLTVAGTIAALVFLESRTTNSALRAATYGALALVAGVTVAAIKSFLAH